MLPTELWYLAATRHSPPIPTRPADAVSPPRPSVRRRIGMRLIDLGLALVDERRRTVVLPNGR